MRLSNTLIYTMLMGAPVWASSIIGNLGTPDVGGIVVCCAVKVGVGFTMNSSTNFTLDSAKVTLAFSDLGSVFGAQLYGISGGNPVGPALVDFDFAAGTVRGTAAQTYNLIPLSAFTLTASTTYWLVLSGGYEWRDTNGVPTGSFATDAGTRIDNLLPPQTVVGPPHPLFEIDGTAIGPPAAVPEPATAGTAGLSLLGLLWVLRRMRPKLSSR
jgi:hypothetical protein